jgi:hypothetical protein
VVWDLLLKGQQHLQSELEAAEEVALRYEAIGSEKTDAVFTQAEVSEFLESILAHIEDNRELEDGEEVDDEADEEELSIEDRPRTAAEVVEQIKLLAEAAGSDWRSLLEGAVYAKRRENYKRRDALISARQHIAKKLILGEDDITRLGVFERQILAAFKHYYNVLQRAQALRLGLATPPVALDVTLSGNQAPLE